MSIRLRGSLSVAAIAALAFCAGALLHPRALQAAPVSVGVIAHFADVDSAKFETYAPGVTGKYHRDDAIGRLWGRAHRLGEAVVK